MSLTFIISGVWCKIFSFIFKFYKNFKYFLFFCDCKVYRAVYPVGFALDGVYCTYNFIITDCKADFMLTLLQEGFLAKGCKNFVINKSFSTFRR